MSNNSLKFSNKGQTDFVRTLRKRVDSYFKENKISKGANTIMVLRTFFCLALWIGNYIYLVSGNVPTIGLYYLLWAIQGVGMVWGAINIGHDAIHGAYSTNKFINGLLSHTFNLNGASAYMWTKMHNAAHHTYTNVEGYDEDIQSLPIIRMSPETDLKPIHRFQHFYAPFFYGLATISWVFIKDYVKFFKNEVGNYNGQKHPTKEYFYLFFYKAIYYVLFIVLPFIFIPIPWTHILLGYLTMNAVAGFYLAMVFMLAHVVEETHFPMPNQEGTIENSWAVHQLYTTANFASRSRFMNFMTGGLNCQVEHHLFPNICSIHYRKLAPIVEATAKEFKVPYYDNPTFTYAFGSHLRFLKKIGINKDYVPYTA